VFEIERARFARTFPRVADVGLGITSAKYSPGSPRTFRDLAWCEPAGNMIWFVQRALRLSRAQLVGLLRHELGHCADVRVNRRGSERQADRIAERVAGVPVRYDARDVQTVGRGIRVRPGYLHQ